MKFQLFAVLSLVAFAACGVEAKRHRVTDAAAAIASMEATDDAPANNCVHSESAGLSDDPEEDVRLALTTLKKMSKGLAGWGASQHERCVRLTAEHSVEFYGGYKDVSDVSSQSISLAHCAVSQTQLGCFSVIEESESGGNQTMTELCGQEWMQWFTNKCGVVMTGLLENRCSSVPDLKVIEGAELSELKDWVSVQIGGDAEQYEFFDEGPCGGLLLHSMLLYKNLDAAGSMEGDARPHNVVVGGKDGIRGLTPKYIVPKREGAKKWGSINNANQIKRFLKLASGMLGCRDKLDKGESDDEARKKAFNC